jgi:hypothetical protein
MSAEGPREETAAVGVDVARIMEEVRGRVAERKAAGVYSDEALEEIARMELRLQEREEYGVEMDRLISWLHAHWEATGPLEREGMVAGKPVAEAVKKVLRVLLAPLSRLLLAKQNQINAKIVQLFSGVLPPLRESAADVEKRLENMALHLEKENARLREELSEVAARLKRLEGSSPDQGPGSGDP